ncbi:MAG: hypothetical protein AVDCRST_MAG85-3265, partial [uncultured Solirubrobacteraceae bacterium]
WSERPHWPTTLQSGHAAIADANAHRPHRRRRRSHRRRPAGTAR